MIEIKDDALFGQIIAESVAAVNSHLVITSGDQIRAVNAIAKATARIQSSGSFMDFDRELDRLLIWSDSNEIYEINANGLCQCQAAVHGHLCWHRAAKRLLTKYFEAQEASQAAGMAPLMGRIAA